MNEDIDAINDRDAEQRARLHTRLSTTHLRWGWGGLLAFSLLGALLEGLHAFKIGGYLDVGNETRRLSLRLGHAHGALLSLLNVAFSWTLARPPAGSARRALVASLGLRAATALLPLGFVLGALGAEGADPGLGIALVPAGAVLLAAALLLIVLGLG